MGRLAGRTAIVTGAAGGIGRATCAAFVAEGASVIATDIADQAEVPDTTYQRLDVADLARWEAVVGYAEACFGPVSILVNNAGLIGPGTIADLDPLVWSHVLSVNLTGSFYGMRAVLPSMRRAKGGAIVNISSTAGLQGYPNRAAYVASKWGVRGLTKTAALEFARDNIRVNSVHPGPIRTPLTEGYAPGMWDAQPIPRFGEPQEVAKMIVFLAADATYSTGGEYLVDGGITTGHAYEA